MTQSIITSGDASNSLTLTNGTDGTLVLQSGPAGSKVNGVAIDALGNPTLLKAPINNAAPCFSAYQSLAQSGLSSGTYVKCSITTKEFDTTTAYDNVTNYRFQPLVAGYYQISGSIYMTGANLITAQANIYKNGSIYKSGSSLTASVTGGVLETSCLVYLNGSTDYVELWAFAATSSGAWAIQANQTLNWFQGALITRTA